MYSPCIREINEAFCHGCCPTPFLSLLDSKKSTPSVTASCCAFTMATASTLYPNTQFTNHESLPSLQELFSKFTEAYPQYTQTDQADLIRAREYYHLSLSNHVCLDYIGHGLFSYSQIKSKYNTIPMASSSSALPPSLHFDASELTSFDISHRSANFSSQILHAAGQESEVESKIRKRIMDFLNISEDDYSMVFTANQSSAFKLLADAYPFRSNRNLLMVYDYESEAVDTLTETSKKRGARVKSAEFSWPNLRIQSAKLRKMVVSKRKRRKKGLFVFPLQSRMTGARYSYQWMSLAQENGWHVLLDACALGPKDMDTLGLSLFRPDFLICSFYKVFGENPSGFGCLFVKKSSASILKESTTPTSIGMVKLVPATRPSKYPEESAISDAATEKISEHEEEFAELSSVSQSHETGVIDVKQKGTLSLEIVESIESSKSKTSENGSFEIKCRGLDHADSLGLILISNRARYLINWLVNALMSLEHPSSECRLSLVRIYGPKIKFGRGPAVAFNLFDWKGEKIDPTLVQKLADRNNISLSCGFLRHIWFPDKYDEETKKRDTFHSGIAVVTASLGFLTNFEDTYRLWAFLSRFLDADFVEKERWRYVALNQKTVEV